MCICNLFVNVRLNGIPMRQTVLTVKNAYKLMKWANGQRHRQIVFVLKMRSARNWPTFFARVFMDGQTKDVGKKHLLMPLAVRPFQMNVYIICMCKRFATWTYRLIVP